MPSGESATKKSGRVGEFPVVGDSGFVRVRLLPSRYLAFRNDSDCDPRALHPKIATKAQTHGINAIVGSLLSEEFIGSPLL